jgi:hypothetical protein
VVYKRFVILLLTHGVKVPLELKLITAPPVPVPVPAHQTRKHTTSFVISQFGRKGRPKKTFGLLCVR